MISIDPPHLTGSIYFGLPDSIAWLLAVCRTVRTTLSAESLQVEFVRDLDFPRFTFISDLADRLESTKLDLEGPIEPNTQIMQVFLDSPLTGTVCVGFDSISDDALGNDAHPVAITISGELVGMPVTVPLTTADQQRAKMAADSLLRTFRAICEELSPVYGAIQVESALPTPSELLLKRGSVGTELFVSNNLFQMDSKLEWHLSAILAGSFQERWRTGTYFSGWSVFNPEKRQITQPLLASKEAAYRLGQTLRLYSFQKGQL